MAKALKHFNLVQGEGKTMKVLPIDTKTASEKYFNKLISDYRRIGTLDSREVKIVAVIPQFG